jgi:hypothetical protein
VNKEAGEAIRQAHLVRQAFMGRTNHRTLVDRGRKAGLRTSELYGALVSSRPEGRDPAQGVSDGNGYVSCFNVLGNRVYRPLDARPKN